MKRDKDYMKWREDVLARDGGCVVCPEHKRKLKNCNAHHLIPNNFKEYSLKVDNGLSLCPSHHTLGKYSAHKNPIWFIKWLSKNRPEVYWIAIDRLRKLEDEI